MTTLLERSSFPEREHRTSTTRYQREGLPLINGISADHCSLTLIDESVSSGEHYVSIKIQTQTDNPGRMSTLGRRRPESARIQDARNVSLSSLGEANLFSFTT